VAKVVDDEDVLLAFYDYPAEHWIHLRPRCNRQAAQVTGSDSLPLGGGQGWLAGRALGPPVGGQYGVGALGLFGDLAFLGRSSFVVVVARAAPRDAAFGPAVSSSLRRLKATRLGRANA